MEDNHAYYQGEMYKGYQLVFDVDNLHIFRPKNKTDHGDKKYQIDDSEKNMLRLGRTWVDDDITSRMPAPPVSELVWIPVAEHYPDDSRQVLIREGNNIATAHWFSGTKKYNHQKEQWEDTGSMWANQHQRIFGSHIDNPTHWMDCEKLLAIPVQAEKPKTGVHENSLIRPTLGKRGWGSPLLSKKSHYFNDDLISLCGKWMYTGELEDDKHDHPDNCAACMKKRTKLVMQKGE